jgi:tetratricopeptide (TPR) repeat protein
MNELSNLSVMFIEPSTNVRTTLHNIFASCGITRISHVLKASTAIPMLQKGVYDIILCEFDLSEGQDGQQLLEDLRRHHILPLTTLFMMVTGERAQSKVISTLELSPTEYLLKPFTTSSLLGRVNRALNKRSAFLPTYKAMEVGDLSAAIACCEQGESDLPVYASDFRFLRADLYLQQGQLEQAESLYNALAKTRATEWARLGLARTWRMQNRLAEAEDMLNALLQENGKLWEAYDGLSEVYEASGRMPEAKEALMRAVELSPHTVRRLRKLGRVALETGDLDTALSSFQGVISKIRHSQFRDPEDYVHLVQALLGKGNPHQATAIVRELGKSFSDFKKTEACGALSSALIDQFNKDTKNAMTKLANVVAASKDQDVKLSNEIKIALAQSCLNNGMREDAEQVMLDVMNNTSDEVERAKTLAAFERAGHKELGENLAEQSRQRAASLAATCEEKLAQGDYQGAVNLMTQAVQQMPHNPDIALNAAFTVLACIEHDGWDDDLGAQAHTFIDNAHRLNATHPRLQELSNQYRTTLKKYNIPFERMSKKSRARA